MSNEESYDKACVDRLLEINKAQKEAFDCSNNFTLGGAAIGLVVGSLSGLPLICVGAGAVADRSLGTLVCETDVTNDTPIEQSLPDCVKSTPDGQSR